MITTGIHIPSAVMRELAFAVEAIHRKTAAITMAEWREAHSKGCLPTLDCEIHVDFTEAGEIVSFQAEEMKKPPKTAQQFAFNTSVPILGDPLAGAVLVRRDCANFLLGREINQRIRAGRRELVMLTDDELSLAKKELTDSGNRLRHLAPSCGVLSECLRYRLIEKEICVRRIESHHQRVAAMEYSADFIKSCQQQLNAERIAAEKWAEEQQISGSCNVWLGEGFDHRSEEDCMIILYRDAHGW